MVDTGPPARDAPPVRVTVEMTDAEIDRMELGPLREGLRKVREPRMVRTFVLTAVIAVGVVVVMGPTPWLLVILALPGFIALGFLVMAVLLYRSAWSRRRQVRAWPHRRIEYTLAADGLTIRGPVSERSIPWTTVETVTLKPTSWELTARSGQGTVVPIALFPPEARDHFLDRLKEHGVPLVDRTSVDAPGTRADAQGAA